MMAEQRPLQLIHPRPPAETRRVAPSQVLGTGIFIVTEVMFFAGLISAFALVKAGAPGGIWPPPGQPRLPIESTALNTVALMLSGVALYYAARRFKTDPALARRPYQVAMGLGLFFVVFQGMEWAALLSEGLTMTSSTYGAFFYLVVGSHALHAVCGLVALVVVYRWLATGQLVAATMTAMLMFWSFVVALWPVLYWQVYL